MPYEVKMHEDAGAFIQIFSEMERRARKGEMDFLPELSVASGKLFATGLGMVLPDAPKPGKPGDG